MLSSVQHQGHPTGERDENDGVQEPAEGCETEVVGPDSAVEVAPCSCCDGRRALGDPLAFVIQTIMGRHGTHKDQAIVVMAKRPGELEKRVDEDCDQQEHLQIPKDCR